MAPRTWWHAVTFERAYSPADEGLARELLLEWATARGLSTAVTGLVDLLGWGVPVVVERDNYGQWAGYGMGFSSIDSGSVVAEDGLPEPRYETRLKDQGTVGGWMLKGREERYEP